MNALKIDTADKHKLCAYQYSPSTKSKGHVVIAPAMGVVQKYYQPLAKWLGTQGFTVTTFDYRGMGESKVQDLRRYQTDLLDWAQLDCSAVLASVMSDNSEQDVFWLGHSLGGQIFPLIEQIEKVKKVITVSSGTGYWRYNSPELKNKALLMWYLIAPVAIQLMGYFPGKRLGIIGDLPKHVMAQWRRWCLHPEYCVGVEDESIREKFTQFTGSIHSLAFSDDEMLSLRNMQDLQALYGSADKKLLTVSPQDMGVKRIGHLGFFRSEFSLNLWPTLLLPELN